MSFPRAPRFTDVVEKTPPVGLYNPLLKTHTPAPKFSTDERFKPGSAPSSSGAVESFRIPQTQSRLHKDKLHRRLNELTSHLEERDALISKLRASREHLLTRIEYLEKTLQNVTQKVSSRRDFLSTKKLHCCKDSSRPLESVPESEDTKTLTETRLSKGTAELKDEIEELINDFRDDAASDCTTAGFISTDLTQEKNLQLCSENEKLVSTVSQLQSEVKALEDNHKDLESKHAILSNRAAHHEKEKLELQQKFDEIFAENKALKEKVSCLQAKNGQLESAISSVTLHYEKLESQLDEANCEGASLRSLLHDRSSEILVLKQHKQDMLEQFVEFEEVVSTMINTEQALSSRLSDMERLHSRSKELNSLNINLEQEVKALKDTLRALQDEKKTTERDFGKLLEDKKMLLEKMQSDLRIHALTEKHLAETMHDLHSCEVEVTTLSDENRSLTKKLNASLSFHEATEVKCNKLEEMLNVISKDKEILEKNLASLTSAFQGSETSLKQMSAENVKLKHELSMSENEAANLKKEKADLLSKVAETEELHKNEQATLDNLRFENLELQGKLLLLEQKVMASTESAKELLMEKDRIEGALLEEKARLEEEVSVVRGRNEELNASKASLQIQLQEAFARLSAAEIFRHQLEEVHREATRDVLQKDEVLRGLEIENNNISKALLEQQKLSSKLEMELASLQVSSESLQARNVELQLISDASKLQLSHAEQRANKYKLVCTELDQQKRHLCDQMKQLAEELTQLRNGQIASLTEKLKAVAAEAEKWKMNFERLQLRIAPFQDQLALYELEKDILEKRNEATESELSKLHHKVSEMMGHQNHKQKIHYLSNLLNERNKYRKESYTLQEKVLKQMKEIQKLQVLLHQQSRKAVLEASTKENLQPPA